MERDPHDDRDRRPPPARQRGPLRPLSERAATFVSRAATIDRRERHRRRWQEVADVRRARRRRWLLTTVVAGASTVVALAVVGALVAGLLGAAVGATIAVSVLLAGVLARWLAASRGALAWDWTLQRHRLVGNPSEQVRAKDHRDGAPTGRHRPG